MFLSWEIIGKPADRTDGNSMKAVPPKGTVTEDKEKEEREAPSTWEKNENLREIEK